MFCTFKICWCFPGSDFCQGRYYFCRSRSASLGVTAYFQFEQFTTCLDKPFPAVPDWKLYTSSITLLNCCLVWLYAIKRWPCLTPVVGELKPSAESYLHVLCGRAKNSVYILFLAHRAAGRWARSESQLRCPPKLYVFQPCASVCSQLHHPLPRRAPPPAPVKQLHSIWSSSCQSLPRYTWMISSLSAQASVKNKNQTVRLVV